MANSGTEQTIERRYVLGDELGGGEYGVVRRARDTLLDRDVAVKEVRFPAEGREEFRARLLRETQAAASLNHSGVVTIFDVIDEDGSALIVMELVDAPTLAQLVEENGPLPPKRVAAIGAELLDTLVAAHERGIVHRDVKPSNVMVSDNGRIRLSDFGVGAAMQSDQGSSSPYASPEQRSGGAVGAASDLWSLGATLLYAVEGGVPDLGAARPTVGSGALGPVLSMMTAAAPDERPTPYALRQMLSRVAAGAAAGGPGPAVVVAPDDEAVDTTASIDTADLPATEAVAVPPQPGAPDGPVVPGGPGPTVIPRPDPTPDPTPAPEPGPSPAPEPSPAPGPSPAPEPVTPTEPVPEEPLPSPEPARPVPPEVVPPTDPEPVRPVEPEIVPPTQPEIVPPTRPEMVPSHPEVMPPDATRGADRDRRGGLLLLAVAVAAVVVLVALVLARSGDNGTDATPPTAAQPQTGSVDAAATSDAAVPPDWVAYTDPETGFAISHPPGLDDQARRHHHRLQGPRQRRLHARRPHRRPRPVARGRLVRPGEAVQDRERELPAHSHHADHLRRLPRRGLGVHLLRRRSEPARLRPGVHDPAPRVRPLRPEPDVGLGPHAAGVRPVPGCIRGAVLTAQ